MKSDQPIVTTTSTVGEAWKKIFCQNSSLSWFDEDTITPYWFQKQAKGEWIQKLLTQTLGTPSLTQQILEAGCGTASYGIILAHMGFQVCALDYSREILQKAVQIKKKAGSLFGEAAIFLLQGNILSLPFPNQSFDLVFNQSVLEYFPKTEERRDVLNEMVRVTRKGGFVGVIVQNRKHPFATFWARHKYPGFFEGPPMHPFDAQGLMAEFEAVGLSQIKIDGIYPWHCLTLWPRWYRNNRFLETIIYLMGQFLDSYIPLPKKVRRWFGIQLLATGRNV